MWVEDGTAILPEGAHRSAAEPAVALPIPLPPVHVPLSPAGSPWLGRRPDSDLLQASGALAFLCLCQVWFCFLPSARGNRFYYQGPPSAAQLAALIADTLLLTTLFVALGFVARSLGHGRGAERLRDLGFLIFLAVPANAVRGLFQLDSARLTLDYWRHASVRGFSPGLRDLAACGVAGLMVSIVCRHRSMTRAVLRALVFLFPVVPLLVAEAVGFTLWRSPPALEAQRARGQPAQVRPRRVVWMIFDEMDYRLAFETPVNLQLPEFNRLASQSLRASHAYPPGGRTMVSVPALLAGRLVTSSMATDTSELRVRYEGAPQAVRWQARDTIFDRQRERGWRTAVAGWYFPYSRIFGHDVEAKQFQGWRLSLNPGRPFSQLMSDELRVMEEGKSQSLWGRSLSAREHKRITTEVVAEAVRQASDPTLDLVFLHLPAPHAPFYYDAKTGQDASVSRPVMGYFDHLQLADRILGEIRRAMQDAGVAGQTIVLVSSDHWNRQADLIDGKVDHRVPFLICFPTSRRGMEYRSSFNTILSRRLVTAMMKGEVRSAGDAAEWIDRERGGLTESPFNGN